MKVLVATKDTQGYRGTDFSFTEEGEILTLIPDGCTERECGCQWCFLGTVTTHATTTAKVVDKPEMTQERLASLCEREIHALCDFVDSLAEGTIVERNPETGELCVRGASNGSNHRTAPDPWPPAYVGLRGMGSIRRTWMAARDYHRARKESR